MTNMYSIFLITTNNRCQLHLLWWLGLNLIFTSLNFVRYIVKFFKFQVALTVDHLLQTWFCIKNNYNLWPKSAKNSTKKYWYKNLITHFYIWTIYWISIMAISVWPLRVLSCRTYFLKLILAMNTALSGFLISVSLTGSLIVYFVFPIVKYPFIQRRTFPQGTF